MRILYILSSYPNYSESFIQNEVLSLQKQGHDVGVLSLKDRDYQGQEELHYLKNISNPLKVLWSMIRSVNLHLGFTTAALRYPQQRKKFLYLSASSFHLIDQIRKFNPDHVISHFLFISTYAASKLCEELNIPLHIRLHTNYSTILSSDAKMILEKASSLSAISAKLAIEIPHRYNLDKNIKIIRQDVDLDLLDRYNTGVSKKSDNEFIAIGRLVPKKGFKNLIEAFAKIDSSYVLSIYGDGPLKHELDRRVIELGQQNRIKLKGTFGHQELMLDLKRAKALIVPSIRDSGDEDGIPTVIVEAMALKTMVLCSDIGAISELIEDRETGYIIDCTNIGLLNKTLDKAISDVDNWPAVLEQANKKVKLEYSRKISIDDIT